MISPSADRHSAVFLTLRALTLSFSPLNSRPSGGLETIFNGEKEKKLQVEAVARRKGEDEDDDDSDGDDGDDPEASPSTAAPTTTVARVAAAAAALADPDQAHMLFVKGKTSGTVRPGVLVLVNDADWELLGGAGARVGAGDRVTFISTLHGG